ncbi:MAG: lytic transglycosylase domain-containing protein [Bacteroidota bacterium]
MGKRKIVLGNNRITIDTEKNSGKRNNFRDTLPISMLSLFLLLGLALNSGLQAQPSYETQNKALLHDYVKKLNGSEPPRRTQERLKKYDHLVKYMSTLSFSRSGVTVSANFLRALISAESAADPFAVSDKNAIGLTQITIETGRVAAKELYEMGHDFKFVKEERLKNLQPSDLFDPAINILICTYLMDKYNSDFGNNLVLTISAWNAGPGAVIRYKGYPPYEETLTLIGRVNSYYNYYRKYYL